ncbi:MAG TPA: hypothetical protein VGP33_05050 [Chloroflexota bacterium]|nr:hypothetical protein [Chloroflexota bacterium]
MVFVERLDFRAAAGALRLTSVGLPATATRVAERDGVQVVALALPDDGRVTAVEIRAALKDVRATLNGDLLLIVTNAARLEWRLVYPAPAAGREALRRLILRPGEPRRTAISQLTGVYDSLQRGRRQAARCAPWSATTTNSGASASSSRSSSTTYRLPSSPTWTMCAGSIYAATH